MSLFGKKPDPQVWWIPSRDLGSELPPLRVERHKKYLALSCEGGYKGTLVPGGDTTQGCYALVISYNGKLLFRGNATTPPFSFDAEPYVEWLVTYPLSVACALIWSKIRADRVRDRCRPSTLGERVWFNYLADGEQPPSFLGRVPARFRERLYVDNKRSLVSMVSQLADSIARHFP